MNCQPYASSSIINQSFRFLVVAHHVATFPRLSWHSLFRAARGRPSPSPILSDASHPKTCHGPRRRYTRCLPVRPPECCCIHTSYRCCDVHRICWRGSAIDESGGVGTIRVFIVDGRVSCTLLPLVPLGIPSGRTFRGMLIRRGICKQGHY